MTAKVNHKWVRIASVLAYLMAISLTAVVLALYYILFYNPYTDLVFDPAPPDDAVGLHHHTPAPATSQPHDQYVFRRQLGLMPPSPDGTPSRRSLPTHHGTMT